MRKNVLLISFVVFTLALSACNGAVAPGGAAAATRSISVGGSAQVAVTPDLAYLQVGVHTEDADVAAAVDANSALVDQVMAALTELGVAEQDLQTSNFNIYFGDKYSPEGFIEGKQYFVDNTVFVTVRNLDTLSAILQAAVEAGANNIYGISFDVSDKSAALTEGRELAVAAARANAEHLASLTGVTLGEIQSINYYGQVYTQPFFGGYGGGGGGAESAAPPISAGQLYLQVDVTIVYEIEG